MNPTLESIQNAILAADKASSDTADVSRLVTILRGEIVEKACRAWRDSRDNPLHASRFTWDQLVRQNDQRLPIWRKQMEATLCAVGALPSHLPPTLRAWRDGYRAALATLALALGLSPSILDPDPGLAYSADAWAGHWLE